MLNTFINSDHFPSVLNRLFAWTVTKVAFYLFYLAVLGLGCSLQALSVAVCKLFESQPVASSSVNRDRTWALCIGSTES